MTQQSEAMLHLLQTAGKVARFVDFPTRNASLTISWLSHPFDVDLASLLASCHHSESRCGLLMLLWVQGKGRREKVEPASDEERDAQSVYKWHNQRKK